MKHQCKGMNKNGNQCVRICDGNKCWQHQKAPQRAQRSPQRAQRSPKINAGMNAVIYTIPTCPWCIKAKSLLNQKGISYQEHIVNDKIMKDLVKRTGQKTVPQIFINNQFIGGYDNLVQYFK